VQASEPPPEWYPFGQDTQVPPVSWLPRVQLATTEEIQQIFIVAKMQTNMVHEGFRCESMFVLWVLWVCLSCCGCRLVLFGVVLIRYLTFGESERIKWNCIDFWFAGFQLRKLEVLNCTVVLKFLCLTILMKTNWFSTAPYFLLLIGSSLVLCQLDRINK
jgi:hypothetical protein